MRWKNGDGQVHANLHSSEVEKCLNEKLTPFSVLPPSNRPPSMAGWPSSTGNNTMSKRSASRQQQFSGYRPGVPSGVNPPFDSLIKDYTKKRWLILALLSVEVSVGVHLEMLIN